MPSLPGIGEGRRIAARRSVAGVIAVDAALDGENRAAAEIELELGQPQLAAFRRIDRVELALLAAQAHLPAAARF